MEVKQWMFLFYLGVVVAAIAEAIILIQRGNEYDFYLLIVFGLIVVAVLLQMVIQLDKLIYLVEGEK